MKGTTTTLRRLERTSRAAKKYLERRDEEILAASAAGHSLRAIGAAAELTPEGVRSVLARLERDRLERVAALERIAGVP